MDIRIANHGTIVQLIPLTEAGQTFLDALGSEGWQWMGNTLCVEPSLVEGLIAHGHDEGLDFGQADQLAWGSQEWAETYSDNRDELDYPDRPDDGDGVYA